MTSEGSRHRIRALASDEDYAACVALQEKVWGVGFSERVPMAILKVGQQLGGVSAGAFDEQGRLDGFVFGLTGLDADGSLLHWSDMLAVRAGAEGRGLGVRLKAFQRQDVLARGVRRMAWTFDPLRARNAHLNLTKLGAVVREYRRDMYGQTDSELHRGIGTDRFVALWLMDSDRVEERLTCALSGGGGAGPHLPDPPGGVVSMALEADTGRTSGLPRPRVPRLGLDVPRVGVSIPADIGAVMARDPDLAAAWRHATRAAFTHYLERGYEVREVVRASSDRGVATYHMQTRDGASGTGDIPSRASSQGNVE